MVGQAGSPTRLMYADMILTRSKVKVKVTKDLNFRKLPVSAHFRSISSAPFAWNSKLMAADDSMGPALQLFQDRFSNFLLGKLSREFKLC